MASAFASVLRAVTICRFSTILPSTTATPSPSACASSKAAIWRRARSSSASIGRKGLVGDGELGRVDQGLAVEAEVAALLAFGAQPVVVLEGVVDAVDDRPARRRARPSGSSAARSASAAVGAGAAPSSLTRSLVPITMPARRGWAAISRAFSIAGGGFHHRPDRARPGIVGERLAHRRARSTLGSRMRRPRRRRMIGLASSWPQSRVEPVDPHDARARSP